MALTATSVRYQLGSNRGWRFGAVLLIIAALAVGAWLVIRSRLIEQRAVENLPPDRRAEIFAARLGSFQALCEPSAKRGLETRCQSDARFLLRFPECADACRALLEPHVPKGAK